MGATHLRCRMYFLASPIGDLWELNVEVQILSTAKLDKIYRERAKRELELGTKDMLPSNKNKRSGRVVLATCSKRGRKAGSVYGDMEEGPAG